MHDLTAFQRDLLVVASGLDEPSGLEIKAEIDDYYETEINHGRLYPNLDDLVTRGLLEKGSQDLRTNYYTVTRRGRRELSARRDWEAQYIPDGVLEESVSTEATSFIDAMAGDGDYEPTDIGTGKTDRAIDAAREHHDLGDEESVVDVEAEHEYDDLADLRDKLPDDLTSEEIASAAENVETLTGLQELTGIEDKKVARSVTNRLGLYDEELSRPEGEPKPKTLQEADD